MSALLSLRSSDSLFVTLTIFFQTTNNVTSWNESISNCTAQNLFKHFKGGDLSSEMKTQKALYKVKNREVHVRFFMLIKKKNKHKKLRIHQYYNENYLGEKLPNFIKYTQKDMKKIFFNYLQLSILILFWENCVKRFT